MACRVCAARPGYALPDLDAGAVCILARIADLEAEAQLLRALVQQKDGEDFVIDDLANQFGDPAQGRVEVERGVDHVGDFEEQGIDLNLLI